MRARWRWRGGIAREIRARVSLLRRKRKFLLDAFGEF